MCSVFLLGGVAVLVAGRAVASAALAFPAALPGDPHHRQCKQDSQHQQGDDTAYSDHKKDLSFERIPSPVYTICPRRATGKRCRLKLFAKNENLGLHLDQRSGIISTFRFGGLAQLVRAPASHAGGLGFESLILHHTVRTRTRFFTKKGSGTFFVYRRFCERTTRNSKRAKTGYHRGDGILPFVLRDQGRFVRTWSSYQGCSFIGGYGILGLINWNEVVHHMKDVHCIEFHTGSREERIPELAKDFPYTASRATLDRYIGSTVPWHWHQAVELFYMESGCVEYTTPGGKLVFPAGSGGFVNSNVLHTTRAISQTEENVQLLHIFDVSLLAGERGSRIEQKYILPITSDPQLEILPLLPDHAAGREILKRLKESFCLSCDTFGYELKLREILTELWLMLVEQSHSVSSSNRNSAGGNDKIKLMLIYIHEHYPENLSVKELAAAAYTSERECYRIFREHLHTTPIAYLTAYRIQIACQMLAESKASITEVGTACGMGNSSYFGKVFREVVGCTPRQYRYKRQNNNTI